MKPAWHSLIHRARQIPYLSGLPKLLVIRALLADSNSRFANLHGLPSPVWRRDVRYINRNELEA